MTEVPQDLKAFFKPLRFLFIIGQYDSLGGAERQALTLAEEIAGNVGAHVAFLAWGGNGIVRQKIEAAGFQAFSFPLNWSGTRLQKWWSIQQLSRFIRQQCPADILLPWIGFNCKIAALIQRSCGAKFTWWNQRDEGRDVAGSALEHRILRRMPVIVSNSFEGRDFLCRRFRLPPERVAIINNGVLLPQIGRDSTLRQRLGIPEGQLIISMLANHTQFKDHQTLVRAFGSLRGTEYDGKCHLILAGRYAETTMAIKALAFDLGLCGHISLPGVIDPADKLWRCTDIAVHSSVTEGCPNAALEAMAHGLPVCGTRISGMRQALGEQAEELLADANDAEKLAKILIQLISEHGRRSKLGADNRTRIASEFSRIKMCTEALTLIRRVFPH